jgi:choline-sulfatase
LAEGNRIRQWINGHPTADFIDMNQNKQTFEGVLALQVHKGPPMKVEFKEIRIKHLPDDLPVLKLKEHPIPKGSTGVQPQGKLPKNWKSPVYQGM